MKRRYTSELEKWAQDAPTRRVPKAAPAPAQAPAPAAPAQPLRGSIPQKAPAPVNPNAAPQRGQRPAPVAPTKPQGGAGTVAARNDIIRMQTAMQKLAETISSTINYDSLVKGLNDPNTADKKQFEKSYGRDAFSNFMVNRFLRSSDMKGVEFDTDPTKKKMPDKNPSDLKYMYTVLDGLRRIGPSSKEVFADGAWGPRTNNALKNIAAIADAVSKLGKELGMESRAFDASKLGELRGLIPETAEELSPEDKVKRAPELTKIITGIQALFLDFKEQVFQKPGFRTFIDGNEPLFKVGPEQKKVGPQLGDDPNLQAIYTDLKTKGSQSAYNAPLANITVPPAYTGGQQLPQLPITAADLLSRESFEAWAGKTQQLAALKQSNPATWGALVKNILSQTKQQISGKLGA